MVRDYETPTVPRAWEVFTREWANRLGLSDVPVVMSCSPDRYGIPIVLRLVRSDGMECVSTRRGSDADNSVERRRMFLEAVRVRDVHGIELDVAGYFVGEGTLTCALCPGESLHDEWQHAIVRELLRIAEPPADPDGELSPDDADDVERAELDRAIAKLLSQS